MGALRYPREGDGKLPVVIAREYTIYVEYIPHQRGRESWLHCDVRKWTPRVYRAISDDLDKLITEKGPFHILCSRENTKLQRFVEMFGFEPTSIVTDEHGTRMMQFTVTKDRTKRKGRPHNG